MAQYFETISIHGNIAGIDGNVSAILTGNISGITAPVTVVGNLSAILAGNVDGITAPVSVSGNIAGITANIAGIDGVVSVKDHSNDDAFGRLRVSNPVQLLQGKRIGSTTDITMTNAVSGSGSAVYDANLAATRLSVGTVVGTAVRQTKTRGIYQPGKSLLLFQTFVLAPPQANLTQQVGYFDTQNGVFLRVSNGVTSFVRRSFATGVVDEEVVPRASWNVDKMDGTGPSGYVANLQLSQILAEDFEWLGVGRVRVGFVVDGQVSVAHKFLNSNVLDRVYMSNPNLPVRWENYATGAITGVANLDAICCSLASEGGYDISGIDMNVDTGNAGVAFASNQIKEVISVRMKASYTSYATAYLQGTSMASTGGASPFTWKVLLNPIAANAGTWTSVNANSILEYNINRAITPDSGIPIVGGVTNAAFATSSLLTDRTVYSLGTDLSGNTDVLSLQINSKSLTAQIAYVNLYMREVY